MTAAFDRTAVGESFSRAAPHYDAWARPQAHIAQRLVDLLDPEWKPRSILDIGCGTGRLTALASDRYPKSWLHGFDLAPGMIDVCRHRWYYDRRFSFEVADADTWEYGLAYDLVISSCSLQWVDDIQRLFYALDDDLPRGGRLAIAVPVAGTLDELDAAHRHATGRPLPGPIMRPTRVYSMAARRAELVISHKKVQTHHFTYTDPRDLLRSLRHIGATLRGQPDYTPLSPSEMRRLIHYYEDRFALGDGDVQATYKTLYLIAEKPK